MLTIIQLLIRCRFISDHGWDAIPEPVEAQVSICIKATIEVTRRKHIDLINRLEAISVASRGLDITDSQIALDRFAASTSRMLHELSVVSVMFVGKRTVYL